MRMNLDNSSTIRAKLRGIKWENAGAGRRESVFPVVGAIHASTITLLKAPSPLGRGPG